MMTFTAKKRRKQSISLIEACNIGTLFYREETKKTKRAKKEQSIGILRVLRSLRFFAVKKQLSQNPLL
jgi:hypothetical protein